jgi:aerobic carbon-monoxide dehydrogenase medium subunit
MSLHPQYARPRTAAQAVELLDSLGTGAMVIAGGQETMPHINHGKLMPSVFVDIGALAELRGVKEDGERISIGALTVHRELQREPLIRDKLPLLAFAAAQVGGGWQVQNRGTVGGNLVAMHPLYDLTASLLALDAEVEILSAKGARRASLAALIKDTSHGLGTTSVLTRLLVAPMPARSGWAYHKLKITEGSYGSANAAAVVALDGTRLAELSVVLGAVAERPIDARSALKTLLGKPLDDRASAQIESACATLVQQPLADQQGDAAWRRAMAGVVARRAVRDAVAMAMAMTMASKR